MPEDIDFLTLQKLLRPLLMNEKIEIESLKSCIDILKAPPEPQNQGWVWSVMTETGDETNQSKVQVTNQQHWPKKLLSSAKKVFFLI